MCTRGSTRAVAATGKRDGTSPFTNFLLMLTEEMEFMDTCVSVDVLHWFSGPLLSTKTFPFYSIK